MPFVTQDRRTTLDRDGLKAAEKPGDICYLAYKEIIKRWNEEPRWTTIHNIRRAIESDLDLIDSTDLPEGFDLEDVYSAELLAFDVFFYIHAMGYEFKKRFENGNIE